MKHAYKYLGGKNQDDMYTGKEALKVLRGIFLFIYILVCAVSHHIANTCWNVSSTVRFVLMITEGWNSGTSFCHWMLKDIIKGFALIYTCCRV